MDYISGNKAAWEAAFDNRKPNWGEDNPGRLAGEKLAFFNADMKKELSQMDFCGKSVAQFCCNNGRELLSLMACGPAEGVGFDIAENIIAQARENAAKAGIHNCHFSACNILEIPESYHGKFDFVFFTIGAITWFRQLGPLFRVAAMCLKPCGRLLINDFHPLMNMLPLPGEDGFNPAQPDRLVYSYFRKEPWLEDNAAGYMAKGSVDETFTSFSHTLSAIVNALAANGLKTVKLNEYDCDVGLTDAYDGRGFPLSFILIAEK